MEARLWYSQYDRRLTGEGKHAPDPFQVLFTRCGQNSSCGSMWLVGKLSIAVLKQLVVKRVLKAFLQLSPSWHHRKPTTVPNHKARHHEAGTLLTVYALHIRILTIKWSSIDPTVCSLRSEQDKIHEEETFDTGAC